MGADGMAYAEHLEGVGEILASVRQVTALAADLAGTPALSSRVPHIVQERAGLDALMKAYGDATVEGISDEDEARDLLRDAVNVTLRLARTYVSNSGRDGILLDRADEARKEFKPGFGRHYGVGLGDRVEQRQGGIGIFRGEVVALDPLDNNRATIRDERYGEETDVTCDCCDQLPTFRQRVAPPSPAPR